MEYLKQHSERLAIAVALTNAAEGLPCTVCRPAIKGTAPDHTEGDCSVGLE